MIQFDTHKVFKKFKDAGIDDKAADAFVEAINESRAADLENLVTKQDLTEVKSELKQDLSKVESSLELKIANVKSDLKEEIGSVKSDVNLLKWMTGFSIALSMTILVKLFLH